MHFSGGRQHAQPYSRKGVRLICRLFQLLAAPDSDSDLFSPAFAYVELSGGAVDIVDQQPAACAEAVAHFISMT
jgi:hypothetical protein